MIEQVEQQIDLFLQRHAVGDTAHTYGTAPLSGEFSLYPNSSELDLYGMVDAVYILYTVGQLATKTDCASRNVWAERILECQGATGWFDRRNLRGHSREHATAYAIGALRLLEVENNEQYCARIQPMSDFLPLLTDRDTFLRWIKTLNFRWHPKQIAHKKVGWHHIWSGSHIGGGVAAAIGMAQPLFEQWWPDTVNVEQWFDWYFDWLDEEVNPQTGYWQRAFWNFVHRQPTLIDMGGAVHFFWVYGGRQRPFPYPCQVIESTVKLQKPTGLYKKYPFCIDLDGNYCIIRSYLQLSDAQQRELQPLVYNSVEANFLGIIDCFANQPLGEIYTDSHGLPGALAALVECTNLHNFPHNELLVEWNNPLDKVWWL